MSKLPLSQKGFAHLLLILLLLAGMAIGVYLVTSKGFFSFKSKASSEAVSFEGNTVTFKDNQYYTTSLEGVKLKLISPLSAPAVSSASPASTSEPSFIPTSIPKSSSTSQAKLSPSTNLLQAGDLESSGSSSDCYSGSAWKRFRPADLTKDEKEISTHETNLSFVNKSQFASSGNCYLAFNCGNYTSCIPGQSVYQDIDVSNLPEGTTIVYGGKFAVAEDQGPGKINFSVFEIGPKSGAIPHEHREEVDKNYKLIQNSFVLNKETKALRYQFYLDTSSTFRTDDMFVGPTNTLGVSKSVLGVVKNVLGITSQVKAVYYYTSSFKWAKSPTDLDKAATEPYDSEPKVIDYIFSSATAGSSETVFVEFVGQGGEKVKKQATITYNPKANQGNGNRALIEGATTIPFRDRFDDNFNGWQDLSDPSSDNSITSQHDQNYNYAGGGSLKLHFTDTSKAVKLEKAFSPSTNIVARVFFYDNMQPALGTMFVVKEDANTFTGLGVRDDGNHHTYTIRTSGPSGGNFYDTYFPRSLGWHIFDIIVTTTGTYAKVDNFLIRTEDDRGDDPYHKPPRINADQKSASLIDFVATWGFTGDSYYDELTVNPMDQKSQQEQISSLLGTYYANWNNVSIASIINRTGTLTKADSNSLRMAFEAVISMSTYGKLAGNNEAKQKGATIFSRIINNPEWRLNNHPLNVFPQGATQAEMVYAAYATWDNLSQADKTKFLQILHDQAVNFKDDITAAPYNISLPLTNSISNPTKDNPSPAINTKAEENGAAADFLAAAVNLFPDAFSATERTQIDAQARCIAYYTIARPSDSHPIYGLGEGKNCGGNIYTITDDYQLGNHGMLTGIYTLSPLYQLGRSAQTYKLAGKTIPDEFKHNVKELYENFLKSRIDTNTYHFVNSGRDWCCGATDSLYDGTLTIKYLESLGANLGFSADDYFNKRSLFFRDITSEWLKNTKPSSIADMYNWFIREKGQNGASKNYGVTDFKRYGITPQPGREQEDADSYNYFMDANIASTIALTGQLFGSLTPPTDRLSAWQAALPSADNISNSATASSSNPYDLNNDSTVNSLDISIFLVDWNKAKTENSNPRSDFNKDGVINTTDYTLLIQHFGQ